jgi:pilus assembly protein Flp/PilA
MIAHFLRNQRGATAIEYAVIASLIAIVIFAAIVPIGGSLTGIFDGARDGIEGN